MSANFSNNNVSKTVGTSTYLSERPPQGLRSLQWWYRIASPPIPEETAHFTRREEFRRGRLGSVILLIMIALTIAVLPVGIIGANSKLFPILLFQLLCIGIAIPFNRRGQVNLAGAIVVSNLGLGIMANIVTTPGGLSFANLPILSLLVMPELLAVSLLPVSSVFIVAALNSLFSVLAVLFLPHAADVAAAPQIAYSNGIFLPINLQIIVAIVSFLWVRSTTQAIERADRAEVVARLEHDLADRDRSIAVEKQRLDQAIQQIEQIHEQVANGNLHVRIPLTRDNVLWSISGKLNMLLTRFQRAAQSEQQFIQTRGEIERVSSTSVSRIFCCPVRRMPVRKSSTA